MNNKSYTSIHNHTDYSNALLGFPDSTNKTTKLIQKAYDIGLNGLSITDHEGVSCHIIATKYFKSMQLDRPFKLILGNEIYLYGEQDDIDNKDYTVEKYTPYYHFLLQSLDMEGHKQLRQLSSRAWYRAYTYKNLMRRPTYYSDIEEIIKPNQGHIVASNACLGGQLDKFILKWKETNDDSYKKEIHKFITWCVDCFGKDNFFFEVQPCNEDNVEQLTVNETLKMLSKAYGIKLIATTDSHYMSKEDSFVHKSLLNSKDGDREVDSFYATAYLMSADELRDYLHLTFTDEEIDEMYDNTNSICDRVQEYNFEHAPMIPQIPTNKIPQFTIEHRYKEYYNEFEDFSFYAHIDNLQDQYFFYRIEQALYNLVELKGKDVKTYISRLNQEFHELRLISEAFDSSMASYYTTMSKIIELIWDCDSLSMPARGSGAGFLVCYLLEITQIDPVPLGDYFPFWRHLSMERGLEIADIDNDSQNSKRNEIIEAIRDYFGDDRVLNVATFSSLTSKTAIEKSCKGLGISDDVAGYLKSLVPIERGNIWSLSDCFYGNEEKGRKKVTELINEVSKYEHLKECIFGLEGLVIGRGIHASGILIGNHPFTEEIACMRSPKGVLCSCYDLHDAEFCSWTKVDMLTIIASDRIRKTMDLLVEHKYMEYQGTLKETYWKYLHPDVLNYDNKEMWDMIKQIYSIFQFDTPVAIKALNQVEPHSVMDLSATNSLLRLMAQDGQMPPIEKFRYYKDDINNWYNDMTEFGLNQNEQDVLKKYLSNSYGLADSQEKVMLISMDKNVSGFTLKQANKLRKSIAKKKADVLQETKELFFNSCKEQGTREIFANYVWNVVFAMSFGYSFSQLHSYSYSIIALQELNLNYFYPSVYWNTACLTVDSQSDEDSSGKSTDYGKIAKSIYKMLKFGCKILPPDINLSEMSFTPNEKDNTILFGLGGIAKINQDIAKQIISNRPYTNFKDFYDKNNYKGSLITKSVFIQLIKAGCFDKTDPNRINTMKWLIAYQNPNKQSLTMSNIDNAINNLKISLPKDLIKAYQFKQYVTSKKFFYCNNANFKSKKDYIVEEKFALPYLEEHYLSSMEEEKDYYYSDKGLVVIDKSLEKAMKDDLDKLKECLKSKEIIDEYNKKTLMQEYKKLVGKEDINKWSFDSICFYPNQDHELNGIDFDRYNLSHFNDLPEQPNFIEKSYGKRTWKQYDVHKICGTVLGRKDNAHLVDILTPDNEVVTLNVPQGMFGYYKQTIDIKGEKDENWFSRGTLIMAVGYRRDDAFFIKNYKNTIYQHSFTKILNVNDDKSLELQLERLSEEEN